MQGPAGREGEQPAAREASSHQAEGPPLSAAARVAWQQHQDFMARAGLLPARRGPEPDAAGPSAPPRHAAPQARPVTAAAAGPAAHRAPAGPPMNPPQQQLLQPQQLQPHSEPGARGGAEAEAALAAGGGLPGRSAGGRGLGLEAESSSELRRLGGVGATLAVLRQSRLAGSSGGPGAVAAAQQQQQHGAARPALQLGSASSVPLQAGAGRAAPGQGWTGVAAAWAGEARAARQQLVAAAPRAWPGGPHAAPGAAGSGSHAYRAAQSAVSRGGGASSEGGGGSHGSGTVVRAVDHPDGKQERWLGCGSRLVLFANGTRKVVPGRLPSPALTSCVPRLSCLLLCE
jgi:hypothetical protein